MIAWLKAAWAWLAVACGKVLAWAARNWKAVLIFFGALVAAVLTWKAGKAIATAIRKSKIGKVVDPTTWAPGKDGTIQVKVNGKWSTAPLPPGVDVERVVAVQYVPPETCIVEVKHAATDRK